jgi:hypothetical protein
MPRIRILPGTYEGRKFDANGATLEVKPYTIPREATVDADRRDTPLPDQSMWWHVTNGVFAGFWVRETSAVYESFSPLKHLRILAGTYTGYRFDPAGTVTNQLARPISKDSGADVRGRMHVRGQPYWLVNEGIWKDYWLAETAATYEQFDAPATVQFRQGSHTGLQFDAKGTITKRHAQTLSTDSSTSASGRVDIAGTTYWLVDRGVFANMWVASSARVYQVLQPPEQVWFGAGPHTGFKFGPNGAVVAQTTQTLSKDSDAPAKGRTTIDGRVFYLMATGVYAEHWVQE